MKGKAVVPQALMMKSKYIAREQGVAQTLPQQVLTKVSVPFITSFYFGMPLTEQQP